MSEKPVVTLKDLRNDTRHAERGASTLKQLLIDFESLAYGYDDEATRNRIRDYEHRVRQEFAAMLQRIIDFRSQLSNYLGEQK